MDDRQFSQLLDHFGLSWRGYRKVRKGVKKRISRHMRQLGCHTMEDYLHVLDNNPEIIKDVDRLMTVSISRFFRDRHLWEVMEEKIIPDITTQYQEKVRVWSAGCALGQEAYSLKILWSMLAKKFEQFPQLQLWATDINPDYLIKARKGIYARSALKEVPEEIKKAYFHASKDKSNYLIAAQAKEGIIWEIYDPITQPPPVKKFQLIFLRNNLLTYYRQEIKEPAFHKVMEGLTDGGFLIIGNHEKLPFQTHKLLRFEGCSYIFEKV